MSESSKAEQKDTVFLGYSFTLADIEKTVRAAIGDSADVVVAKDEITGEHILQKIRRQIEESTLCLFDLTGHNINVALELGLAMGLNKPIRLLFNPASGLNPPETKDFFSDLGGFDHLRYVDYEELQSKLASNVQKFLAGAHSGSTAKFRATALPYPTVSAKAYLIGVDEYRRRGIQPPSTRSHLVVETKNVGPGIVTRGLLRALDGTMPHLRESLEPIGVNETLSTYLPLDGQPGDFYGAPTKLFLDFESDGYSKGEITLERSGAKATWSEISRVDQQPLR